MPFTAAEAIPFEPGLPGAESRPDSPTTPVEPTYGEVLSAQVRRTNIVASARSEMELRSQLQDIRMKRDVANAPIFNPAKQPDFAAYSRIDFGEDLAQARSKEEYKLIREKINGELDDADNVARGGKFALLAGIGAGMTSPEMGIPAFGFLTEMRAGMGVVKTAIATGEAGLVAAGISETLLHASQRARTWEESASAMVSSSMLTGGLGGLGRFVTKGMYTAAKREVSMALRAGKMPSRLAIDVHEQGKLDSAINLHEQALKQEYRGLSLSAARKKHEDYVLQASPDAAALRESGFLRKVTDQVYKFSPFGRLLRSEAPVANWLARVMSDSPVLIKHDDNFKMVQAMETGIYKRYADVAALSMDMIKMREETIAASGSELDIFKGFAGRRRFNEAVGEGLFSGDEVPKSFTNPKERALVNQGIKRVRKFLESYKEQSIEAGFLQPWEMDEVDLSYFHRIFDEDQLALRQGEFVDRVSAYWIREKKMDPTLARQKAQEFINARLSGVTIGGHPIDSVGPAGPWRDRTLLIPSTEIMDFLKKDVDDVLWMFVNKEGPQLEFEARLREHVRVPLMENLEHKAVAVSKIVKDQNDLNLGNDHLADLNEIAAQASLKMVHGEEAEAKIANSTQLIEQRRFLKSDMRSAQADLTRAEQDVEGMNTMLKRDEDALAKTRSDYDAVPKSTRETFADEYLASEMPDRLNEAKVANEEAKREESALTDLDRRDQALEDRLHDLSQQQIELSRVKRGPLPAPIEKQALQPRETVLSEFQQRQAKARDVEESSRADVISATRAANEAENEFLKMKETYRSTREESGTSKDPRRKLITPSQRVAMERRVQQRQELPLLKQKLQEADAAARKARNALAVARRDLEVAKKELAKTATPERLPGRETPSEVGAQAGRAREREIELDTRSLKRTESQRIRSERARIQSERRALAVARKKREQDLAAARQLQREANAEIRRLRKAIIDPDSASHIRTRFASVVELAAEGHPHAQFYNTSKALMGSGTGTEAKILNNYRRIPAMPTDAAQLASAALAKKAKAIARYQDAKLLLQHVEDALKRIRQDAIHVRASGIDKGIGTITDEFIEEDLRVFDKADQLADAIKARTGMIRRRAAQDAVNLYPFINKTNGMLQRQYAKARTAIEQSGKSARKREKALAKLDRNLKRDIGDIVAIRDGLLNRQQLGRGHALDTASRYIRRFNHLTLMGGVVLSSLSDTVMPLFTNGFAPWFGAWMRAAAGLIRNIKGILGNKEESPAMKERLFVLSTSLEITGKNTRQMDIQGITQASIRTRTERTLDYAANLFNKASGLHHWTILMKRVSAQSSMTMIYKLAKKFNDGGRAALSRSDLANLSFVRLDLEHLPKIYEQFIKHGEIGRFHAIAHSQDWDTDAYEALNAMSNAILSDVRQTIIVPSHGDIPVFMSNPLARLIRQFTGFSSAATNRIFARALQQRDFQALLGMTSIGFMGLLSEVSRRLASGQEIPDDPYELAGLAVRSSGMTGYFSDISHAATQIFGSSIHKLVTGDYPKGRRVSAEWQIGSLLLGPTYGQALRVGRTLQDVASFQIKERTLDNMDSFFNALSNLWYLRRGFDYAERASAEWLGLELKKKPPK